MFIDLKDGSISIDDGFVLGKILSFKDFKKSPYYKEQSKDRVFTLDGKHEIGQHIFYIGLYFKEGYLYQIFLELDDESIKGFEELPKLKALHDEFLHSIDIKGEKEFIWGTVGSYYNERSGDSDIVVTYK